ncbi:hypothetical protein [Shinella sp.]|uniref:hypothetical protein n=1 Tax=Shinella sp. TaxID=1870904 RepID=UPI00258B8EA4|nr:hypothetical protein [Shinella sp.]MCW5712244.1 hypothetical protein [Shinella sp.]
MEVLSMNRLDGPGNTLAVACVQVTPDIRVNGLRLVRAGNGDLRVYSPNAGGLSVLSFAPAAIAELKSIIIDAYRSETADDRNRH